MGLRKRHIHINSSADVLTRSLRGIAKIFDKMIVVYVFVIFFLFAFIALIIRVCVHFCFDSPLLSPDFPFGMTGRRSEKPLKSILANRPREAARAAGRHQKARKAPAPRAAAQTASQSPATAKGGAPISSWVSRSEKRILWKDDQNRMA